MPPVSRKRPAFDNPAGLEAADVAFVFERLGGDGPARYEARTAAPDLALGDFLRWCLARWPLVPVGWVVSFAAFCRARGEPALPAAEMLDVFVRLDVRPDPESPGRLLDEAEDRLLVALLPWFAADFAPFRAVVRERRASGAWHADACHAFALVDWLLGEEVGDDEGAAIARIQAHRHHVSFNATPRSDGAWLRPLARRPGLADTEARTLGVALVGIERWRAELAAVMARDPEWSLERVVDVLDPLPLGDAMARAAEGDRPPTPRATEALVDFARRRPEPAAELLRAAGELATRSPRPRLAEVLALVAAERLLDAGQAVPEELDPLLGLTLRHRAPLPLYRAVLPLLPHARRLALIERDLAQAECRGVSITALTEEEITAGAQLFQRLVRHSRFDPVAAGQLGAPLARAVEALLGGPVDAALRPRLEHALLEAAAVHVARGGAFDEGWGFYLILAPPQSEAVAAIFAGLPEPLRSDLLLEAVREQPRPSEVLWLLRERGLREEVVDPFIAAYRAREKGAHGPPLPGRLAALNAPAEAPDDFGPALARLRRLAAAAPGPKQVVYVLQIVPEDQAGPAPSLTLLGGPAPAPIRSRGKHLLTIDLHDAPELAARFPGARAASLFVPREPDPDRDRPEAYFWKGHAEAEVAPALAGLAKRRRRLVVHRCEVPESVFAREADRALVGALVALPGYLLGKPITLQDGTASEGEAFVAQLGDELGLPLGDEGQLYSFVEGAWWDCR